MCENVYVINCKKWLSIFLFKYLIIFQFYHAVKRSIIRAKFWNSRHYENRNSGTADIMGIDILGVDIFGNRHSSTYPTQLPLIIGLPYETYSRVSPGKLFLFPFLAAYIEISCSGPEVVKLFLFSTQLRSKFILSINIRMPTICILTFISRINDWLLWFKPKISIDIWVFPYSWTVKISFWAELSMKKVITSDPGNIRLAQATPYKGTHLYTWMKRSKIS